MYHGNGEDISLGSMGGFMFNRLLILAALVAVPCSGAYNPKDIFFESAVTRKGTFAESSWSIATIMRNVPLYFVSANNDARDYVKNVSFMVEKEAGGIYNLEYKVISSYRSKDMVLKNIQKEVIEPALKDSFPNLQDTTLEAFLTAFAASSGRIRYTVKSLHELSEAENNKQHFLNSMTFVNHFLPIDKLHFDEADLLISVPTQRTGWRAWLSLNAWRTWLFSK
jgi:hypothetical protein